MFEFIRRNQRLMLLVLIILILPSFALIGVSGYSNYVSGDKEIVKIGDSALTAQEFDRARRAQLDEAQRSNPANFDINQFDNPAAREQLLESLIDQRVVVNVATQDRFNVSDAALRDAIAAIPQFQEEGVFSPRLYNQTLTMAGLNARDFEQGQRGQMALSRVLEPVGETARVLPTVMQQLEQALTEARTIRVKQFSAADYASQVELTDQELKDWYEANKESLRLPEQVQAEYLLLNEQAATASVGAPDQEQLKQYYEQNKSRFVRPARAHLSHILISLDSSMSGAQREQAHAKAKQIAAQAQANKDAFADLAKQQSQDSGSASEGGDLGWITHGSWPQSLQSAVFSLKQGEVSDVIEGPSGFHIFKIIETQPEQGESFADVKDQIEQEVRKQLAADRFADMATQLTNLVYENDESLEPAAQALGVPLRTASGITRQGLLGPQLQGSEDLAALGPDRQTLDDNRVRSALFATESLSGGKNSGVIEVSPDTIFALRVKKVTPAHVPEFEQLKERARSRLTAERAALLAKKQAELELAKLQKSELEPSDFAPEQELSRADFGGFDEHSLNAIMAVDTAKLPAYVGVESGSDYRIVQVLKYIPGQTGNPGLEFLTAQLDRVQGESEMAAVLRAMKQEQGVKVLPAAQEEIQADNKAD